MVDPAVIVQCSNIKFLWRRKNNNTYANKLLMVYYLVQILPEPPLTYCTQRLWLMLQVEQNSRAMDTIDGNVYWSWSMVCAVLTVEKGLSICLL